MGQRIAVLGAGPMGLAVGYQLARDGLEPVIFEADDRVGGMAASFDFGGLSIERYYHFHCISDIAFMHLLDEMNLQEKLHWVETKMGYYYRGKVMPWGNPVSLMKFPQLGWIAKIRYALHTFVCTHRSDWHRLDAYEATRWIRSWVGSEAYEVLWRRLFDYKFYDYSECLSAAWIWSRIRRIGRSRYSLFREKLGYLEGGSQTLLNAMKYDIEKNGGEVRLSSPVSRIAIMDGRVIGLEVCNEFHRFSKVISTVPLPYLPDLLPDLEESVLIKLRALKNIAVVCVIVKLSKSLTENFWLNVNDHDMDIPGLVEYTNLRALDNHIIYVPFYMPSEHPKYQDSDDIFMSKVRAYLMKINPSVHIEDFLDIQSSRYRYAQPICKSRYLEYLPPVDLNTKGLWAVDTSHYYPEDRGISESIGLGRKIAKQASL
jgi:protoporphyrinogen oxidase